MFRKNPLLTMNESEKKHYQLNERQKIESKCNRVNGYMDSSRIKQYLNQSKCEDKNFNNIAAEDAKKSLLLNAMSKDNKVFKHKKNHIFVQDHHGTYIK